MKQRMSSEFIYQIFALLIAVIVVHAVYVGVIRPSANAQIERNTALQAAGEEVTSARSLSIAAPVGSCRVPIVRVGRSQFRKSRSEPGHSETPSSLPGPS